MKPSPLGKIIISLAAALTILLLTSCPQEITAPMVALVQDSIAPTINIISPKGGDNYYSSVTISGVISDDVKVENDGGGQIVSISYEIANDDFRKGKINIGLDNQVTADTIFGSGTIDFDIQTGNFSFTFSTITPNTLRDLLSLTVTAVDRNNNQTVQQLNLLESEGPVLDFNFFDKDGKKISTLSETKVFLMGSVENSEFNKSADEIVEISWGVVGSSIGGTLDTYENSAHWDPEKQIFQTTNNIDTTKIFEFDPGTKFFKTVTQISVEDDPKYFYFVTKDKYGHSTRVEKLLTEPASLMLFTESDDNFYYSPSPAADRTTKVSLPFKLTDPNDALTFEQIAEIKCTYSPFNLDDATPNDEVLYTYSTVSEEAAKTDFNNFFTSIDASQSTFNAELSIDSQFNNLEGNIYATVIVTDNEGKSVQQDYTLFKDSTPPVINIISFASSSGDYLKQGDTVTLSFSVTDMESGVGTVNDIDIYTTEDSIDQTSEYISSGIAEFQFTSETSDADGNPIDFSITISDKAGNKSTRDSTLAEEYTFYGPYENNSYSGTVDFESDNERTGVFYGRATAVEQDTVTIDFISTRILSGPPTASIAGTSTGVNVTNSGLNYQVTYTLDRDDISIISEGDNIPFTINLADAAGNTDIINNTDSSTDIIYDDTAPIAPNEPIYTGSNGDNYINNVEADSVSMTVAYDNTYIKSGDIIQLFLDASTNVLLGEDLSSGGTSSNIPITNRNLIDAGGGSSDGGKQFYARVIDKAGNVGENSIPLTGIILDTTAPVADITGNASYGYGTYSTVALGISTTSTDIGSYSWSVTGTGTDPNTSGATFDPPVPVTNQSTFTLNSCSIDGQYTTELAVVDNAGNPGTTTDSFDFIWDGTVFTQTVAGFPTNVPPSTGTKLDLTTTPSGDECGIATYLWEIISEPAGADNMTLSAPDSASTNFTADTDGSDDGDYTIRLTTTDNLGRAVIYNTDNTFNWETAPPSWKDSMSPIVIGSINNTAYTVTVEATDGGSGLHDTLPYQWTIDGPGTADSTQNSATLSFSGFTTNGDYSAYCIAQDNAGNQTVQADQTVSFLWDTSAPDITITGESPDPASNKYLKDNDEVIITFTLTDDSTVLEPTATIMSSTATIDDSSAPTYTASYTLTGKTSDADGTAASYTINYSDSIDVGTKNTDSYTPGTAPYIFYEPYDNLDPDYFYLSTPGINAISDNYDGTYYWAAEGDLITVTFTGVRELTGEPTVIIGGQTIDADDVVYNTSDKTCSVTFIVPDPDITTLTDGTDNLAEGADIPITITVTDAAGNLPGSYTFTSAVNYDCMSPAQPADAPNFPGSTYAGYINLNNIDDGSITFKVDGITVPASPSIITTYLYRDTETTPIAETTVTGNGVSLTITGDAATLLSALGGEGSHDYYAQSVDSAGNPGTPSATVTIIVDTVIDTYEAGDSYSGTSSKTTGGWTQSTADAADSSTPITSAWTFYLSGAPTANVNATNTTVTDVEITACSADGTYTGRLTVTDDAGNSKYDEFTFVWDEDPPTVETITNLIENDAPPADTDGQGFAKIASASDIASGIESYKWEFDDPEGDLDFDDKSAITHTHSEVTDTLNVDNNLTDELELANTNTGDDGIWTVRLTVTDNLGHPTIKTFQFLWDTVDPILDVGTDITNASGTDISRTPTTHTDNNGIETYAWTITPPDVDNISASGLNTDTLIVTGYALGTVYTAELTVTDYSNNSTSDSFTFTSSLINPKALSPLAHVLSTGGDSGSGMPPTSGRINTANFDELKTASPASSANKYAVNTSASLTNAATASSRSYNGSLYNKAASAAINTAGQISSTETIQPDITQPAAAAPKRVYNNSFYQKPSAVEKQLAELEPEFSETIEYEPLPEEETVRAPRTVNLTALSSKASAAVTGRKDTEPKVSGVINEPKPIGTLPVIILLLLSSAGAVIIVRKRRL
ncbi:MAG: hypothetical protein JEZ04_15270 [Spirochaetales bacterium]|nr:hypothetical protein [Spirochaetales bacterium]